MKSKEAVHRDVMQLTPVTTLVGQDGKYHLGRDQQGHSYFCDISLMNT